MTAFALTPITIERAGLTTYGLFAALTSFTALLSFSDFGLANALMVRLAAARASQDRAAAVGALTNTLILLSAIGLLFASAGIALSMYVPWSGLLNAPPTRESELQLSAVVIAACIGIGVPAGVATKIYFGLQQAATASVWTTAAAITSAGTVALVADGSGSLPLMVAAQVGLPSIFAFFSLIVVVRRNELLGVAHGAIALRSTVSLLKTGRLFVVLQLAAIISYQLDVLIVVRLLGPEEAAVVAVTMKFLMLPLGLASLFFLPLWPAFAEARQVSDLRWVCKAYRRASLTGAIAGLFAAPLCLLFGQKLVRVWTDGLVDPPVLLIAAGALWILVGLYNQPQSMLLNGLHVEGFQLKVVSITVAANLALSIVLAGSIGLSGPLIGSVLSLSFLTILPSEVWIRRFFRRQSPR